MTKTWLKPAIATSFALALLTAPALSQSAQGVEQWNEWNANADVGIDENEFGTGFGSSGVWDTWDANDDDMIDENEWTAGIGDNEADFNERFGETAWDDWDVNDDAMLDRDEFNTGVYGAYDADDSGFIEEPEFGDLGDDIGDEGIFDV